MSLRYVLSPSGGLAYHLIARRRSRALWRPFRAVVREWLTAWLTSGDQELIVFGPSAGWTLPLDDFARFSKLTFVEPDPLARSLLRRRLKAAGVRKPMIEFVGRADLLPWGTEDASALAKFLNERPQAAILFSNVLGQVSLHLTAKEKSRAHHARQDFFDALSGRKWASYHDLYSGSSIDSKQPPNQIPANHSAANFESAAQKVFTVGDVIDHETAWLSDGRETSLALWSLTEKSTHLIAFVRSPLQKGRS